MAALEAAGHQVIPIGVSREGVWLTDGDPMSELQAGSPLFGLDPGRRHEPGEVVERVEALAVQANSGGSGAVIPKNGWAGQLDVLFPVLHGPMGEDGTIQGLFDLMDVPYVGAGVAASAVAMDKALAKQLLAQAGIPQVDWLSVLRKEWRAFPDQVTGDIAREIGFPCFVKPANMGSSVGVGKAHTPAELPAVMSEACRHDRKILVERDAQSRELEVSVLGNDQPMASVVGEIIPGHEFYDYEAKYVDDSARCLIPAEIPDETSAEVRDLAIRAYRTLDCAGMARVDFFYHEPSGTVYLNEVNTIPGFTSISMYPKLWEASGLSLPDLVSQLVDLAIERYDDRHDAG
jgi:D-alanine-D-alanine ligase